jgi:hypothetical protein
MSLSNYIQNQQAATVLADQSVGEVGGELPETITPIQEAVTPVQSGEAQSAASPNTQAPTVAETPESEELTTPDQNPAVLLLQQQLQEAQAANNATRQQMEAFRQQQAREAAQREEQAILAQIQSIPDEEERQKTYFQYQQQRNQSIIQAQQAQLQAMERQSYQQAEAQAKNMVIAMTMLKEGIDQQYAPILHASRDSKEFDANLALLKQAIGKGKENQNQQTRQEIVESGVYAAGGANAGFVPPPEPKERSGDLMSLINSRPRQLVNV